MEILEAMKGECSEHNTAWYWIYLDNNAHSYAGPDLCYFCLSELKDNKPCINTICRARAALTLRCWGTHDKNETDW